MHNQSANQLSIYGAVADMCEESKLLFSDSASTGELGDKEEQEVMVSPQDVLNEIDSRPTNDPARGDTLCKDKQQIEDLPEDRRSDKKTSKQVSYELLFQEHTL